MALRSEFEVLITSICLSGDANREARGVYLGTSMLEESVLSRQVKDVALIVLLVASLSANLLVLQTRWSVSDVWSQADRTYDYSGDSFPELYPVGDLPETHIVIEDTAHYQISTADAYEDWASMFPRGGGFVHLGRKSRPFGISMYHQLACVDNIRTTLATPFAERTEAQLERNHQCFNYLRQTILCEPELRLEPESDKLNDFGLNEVVDGLGVDHVCKDWTMVFAAVETNFATGSAYKTSYSFIPV
ncbi:hypothetical protein OE88DRAFT_1252328 [Heliocybe sulcata]|uniref:Uncharacterized protein n=1 Tax=Heliocybe sulcata TaxID=5364 RepID=A0A5C3NAG9_9AGAM|nr:hypothetical protein OE88DRAFT_1252328 [Heliocybe sulcata]